MLNNSQIYQARRIRELRDMSEGTLKVLSHSEKLIVMSKSIELLQEVMNADFLSETAHQFRVWDSMADVYLAIADFQLEFNLFDTIGVPVLSDKEQSLSDMTIDSQSILDAIIRQLSIAVYKFHSDISKFYPKGLTPSGQGEGSIYSSISDFIRAVYIFENYFPNGHEIVMDIVNTKQLDELQKLHPLR